MARAKNPLKLLYDAIVARDGVGAYKQKQYASDLRQIAALLGFSGYSDGAVSMKMRSADLSEHRRFDEVSEVVRKLCTKKQIDIARVFEAERQGGRRAAPDEADNLGLTGVWQHLMLQNVADRNAVTPSTRVRRALLIYEGNTFRIVGNTTTWQGEMRVRRQHVYHHAIEDGEHEEIFGIYQLPLPRRQSNRPLYHCGLCLGVAVGENDYPSFPVVASRCVLRRLDVASKQLEKDGAGEDIVNTWKTHLCGYLPRDEMEKARTESLSKIPEAERLRAEQFIYVGELLARLDENRDTRNFGERTFLR